uniref:Signal recognition particle receptor subunit beta n=1 Tax=Ciona savignyi TaxID=51511 RepID=H2ZK96_CIOSA
MDRSCCEIRLEMQSSISFYKSMLDSYGISQNLIGIIGSLILVILTTVIWKLTFGRSAHRTGILLAGLSDAGKTILFTQLTAGVAKETHTSLKENEAQYLVANNQNKTALTVVDLPGHDAIRLQYLEKYKDNARGIVFVIDSGTFQKSVKDVAEFLFHILTDKQLNKIAPSVCIACNKQDLLNSKTKTVIFNQLEKELNTVRKTQSAALSSTAGGTEDSVFLGRKGEDFQFSHLSKFKIEFLECNAKCSAVDEDVNLNELKSWISSLV